MVNVLDTTFTNTITADVQGWLSFREGGGDPYTIVSLFWNIRQVY